METSTHADNETSGFHSTWFWLLEARRVEGGAASAGEVAESTLDGGVVKYRPWSSYKILNRTVEVSLADE